MLDRDILFNLFITKNLTRKQVADELNVPESRIKAYLAKYNIVKPKALISEINRQFKHTKGKKWFTNGTVEILASECPEGFVEGRLGLISKKISDSLKEHEVSQDTKNKISIKHKNKSVSQDTRQKISNYMSVFHPMKGKHHTQESIQKIKEARHKQTIAHPLQDTINNFFNNNDYKQFLNQNNVIDLDTIFKLANLEDNGNNRKLVYNFYRSKGIEISFGSNHASENELKDWISTFYNGSIIQASRSIVKGYEIDLFFPNLNVAIEYNGNYWHSVNKKGCSVNYHYKKSLACYEQGIRLIHIWEDQWKNERLRPILEGIIKTALKIQSNDIQKIYARKCQIVELDSKTYTEYCNSHHTQLSRPARVKLGLYYNNELVQVASFTPYKTRNGLKDTHGNYEWEWVRGCEDFNHSRVIGGVSKLFNYFIKNYNPKSVLCYSDFNLFCGNGYSNCGFELKGFTGPDKFYINEYGQRVNRSASRYKEYMKHVKDGSWLLCYGAGSLKFVWTNS